MLRLSCGVLVVLAACEAPEDIDVAPRSAEAETVVCSECHAGGLNHLSGLFANFDEVGLDWDALCEGCEDEAACEEELAAVAPVQCAPDPGGDYWCSQNASPAGACWCSRATKTCVHGSPETPCT